MNRVCLNGEGKKKENIAATAACQFCESVICVTATNPQKSLFFLHSNLSNRGSQTTPTVSPFRLPVSYRLTQRAVCLNVFEGNEEEQQLFGHKHTGECDFKLVDSGLSKGRNYLEIDLGRLQQTWQQFRLIISPANGLFD